MSPRRGSGIPAGGPGRGGPARGPGRGSQRAPAFTEGNRAAQTHGARSERMVGPLAAEIREGLEAMVAGTPAEAPSFELARAALARKLAQVQLLADYLAEHGPLDADGEVRNAARFEAELLDSVEKSLSGLGLTPTSAAALGVDMMRGESLVDELARARAIREDAERRHGGDAA